jgi:outer membrane protein OmpA-like peptidoglycan-associated protein
MLCWLTVLMTHTAIEADLARRSKEALTKAGLGWASATFSGRDGVLVGQATDDSEPVRSLATVRDTWGVRAVDNQVSLIERADNYVWGAQLRDNRIRLSGFVPNEEARRTINGVAQATFPGREIQDQTKLARGVPGRDAWLGGVSFALKQLAQLKRGNVDLDGLNLSIEGEASDSRSYRQVKTAITSGLPQTVKLKSEKVRPPVVTPYTWSVAHTGNQVALTGHVPSEKSRDDIFNATKKTFPKAAVIDRMETGSGEPKGFEQLALAAIRSLEVLDDGHADLRDAQVSLTGLAGTEAIADAAKKLLRAESISGVRYADQIKVKEIIQRPFTTSASIDGQTLILSGFAPSAAAKTSLADAAKARFPAKRIIDQVQVAGGAPQGWQTCTQAGLLGLGQLGNGQMTLTDQRLLVSGVTDSEDLNAALPATIRGAAGANCEVDPRITLRAIPEPNLNWRAVHTAGEVILDGEVPDSATRGTLIATATRLFPGQRVVDRMTVQPGSSRRWAPAAELGLTQLARLRTGEARLSGQQLTVTGEAADPSVVGSVKDQLSRLLPQGYAGRDQIVVRNDAAIQQDAEARRRAAEDEARRKADAEAARRKAEEDARRKAEEDARRKAQAEADAEAKRRVAAEDEALRLRRAEADRCKQLLTSAAAEGVINFARASAELDPSSTATLDKLVAIARTCPAFRIEIEGHTDAEGLPERNQRLSERRAQSVVDYLVRSGIEKPRLVAIGYGATRPIVANDTDANRARNRRIAFDVKAN